MSLSYTTGNPSNLTAGSTASMTDISGPFADIKTFLTDGSAAVGDTILTSPTNAIWRPVAGISCAIQAGATVGSYWASAGGLIIASGGSSSTPAEQWSPSSVDVAVTSKTTRLRSVVTYSTNPNAVGVTLTWGLYPVNSVGGGALTVGYTLGTVLASSTAAVASPAANSNARIVSSSFDYSTASATTYVLGVALSGTTGANSYVHFTYRLEQRHT